MQEDTRLTCPPFDMYIYDICTYIKYIFGKQDFGLHISLLILDLKIFLLATCLALSSSITLHSFPSLAVSRARENCFVLWFKEIWEPTDFSLEEGFPIFNGTKEKGKE